jgi:hypothetical protein
MATPIKVTGQQTPKAKIEVQIYVDPKTKTITVKPDPFWVRVSNLEEAMWLCMQPHKHGHNECFTVHFPEESPFSERAFANHGVRSGLAVVQPDKNKLYKYTVTVPRIGVLDPKGGVTP